VHHGDSAEIVEEGIVNQGQSGFFRRIRGRPQRRGHKEATADRDTPLGTAS